MKTSNFFAYRGPGRISIARWAPRGTPAGFRIVKELAPRREMLRMEREPYERIFVDEILGALEPEEMWQRLHALADPHEPILLCWEQMKKPGEWCHRHMVARWFERALGVEAPELDPKKPSKNGQLPLQL